MQNISDVVSQAQELNEYGIEKGKFPPQKEVRRGERTTSNREHSPAREAQRRRALAREIAPMRVIEKTVAWLT